MLEEEAQYIAICVLNDKYRLKLIASLDVPFHIPFVYNNAPVGSGGKEEIWIGNDANLRHAGTLQKCPSAVTMLEGENDKKFALEIHYKRENWSLSMFVLFCCCGNNIECFLETTNQLLSSCQQFFLSLFDTLYPVSQYMLY